MDREFVKSWLIQHVGIRYKWGGDNPLEGMDCSGFAIEFLNSFYKGVPDMTANALRKTFNLDTIHRPRLGSLVFFGSPGLVTHVGVAVCNKFMVEAGGGGSNTVTAEDAKKHGAYVRVRPINSRSDLVGFAHPRYIWE